MSRCQVRENGVSLVIISLLFHLNIFTWWQSVDTGRDIKGQFSVNFAKIMLQTDSQRGWTADCVCVGTTPQLLFDKKMQVHSQHLIESCFTVQCIALDDSGAKNTIYELL